MANLVLLRLLDLDPELLEAGRQLGLGLRGLPLLEELVPICAKYLGILVRGLLERLLTLLGEIRGAGHDSRSGHEADGERHENGQGNLLHRSLLFQSRVVVASCGHCMGGFSSDPSPPFWSRGRESWFSIGFMLNLAERMDGVGRRLGPAGAKKGHSHAKPATGARARPRGGPPFL